MRTGCSRSRCGCELNPIVAGFVRAMRDEQIMRQEFSYIPPEIERYDNRFICIRNGNCLGAMLYTVQAMLGYGDDHEDLIAFQQIALKGFERILQMSSLEEILKKRKGVEKNIQMLADALNHINRIMKPDNQMHVKTKSRYYAPCFALVTPIRAFDPDYISTITYRRILTEIAMLGVGERVGVVKESLEAISAATDDEGILKMNFGQPYNKRYSPLKIEYPTPYVDGRLEEDYKKGHGLDCDLTFWAVQFKSLVENRFFLDK